MLHDPRVSSRQVGVLVSKRDNGQAKALSVGGQRGMRRVAFVDGVGCTAGRERGCTASRGRLVDAH
jgi:hypothetical protein